MAAKTERFEMRLDAEILANVDGWRAKMDDLPSRAEAMRRLIELGLARASGESIRLTDGEKLLVIMLRDIYRHLDLRGGEIDPDFVGEVISGGHYWAPKWEMQGLFHDHEDDPREVQFVIDVLDMWTFIEGGYATLSKKDKERVEKEADPFGKQVKFMGFDGNNESTHMGIASFMVEKMNRFSRFRGRNLNSHSPTLTAYRQMLTVFEPIRRRLVGVELNASQIISILRARTYSE